MTSNPQNPINNLPLGSGVKVLASQNGLIALEKPAGLMSHPNRRGDYSRCLLTTDYDYEDEVYTWEASTGAQRAWLLNRLDSPTSGILLLAVDEKIVPTIRQLFASHKVNKTYYALVKHTPSPVSGCWKDHLKQDSYRSAKVGRAELGNFAETRYHVIDKSKELPVSLVQLIPLTGRTHQLRIQCNYHRHPIVGDRTHGDFSFNRKISSITGEKRMMLHSAEISLSYVCEGKSYDFYAKSTLPEALTKWTNFKP